jgi:hypothetical protein
VAVAHARKIFDLSHQKSVCKSLFDITSIGRWFQFTTMGSQRWARNGGLATVDSQGGKLRQVIGSNAKINSIFCCVMRKLAKCRLHDFHRKSTIGSNIQLDYGNPSISSAQAIRAAGELQIRFSREPGG